MWNQNKEREIKKEDQVSEQVVTRELWEQHRKGQAK